MGAILEIDIDCVYHFDLGFNYLCIGLWNYFDFLIDKRMGYRFLIGHE